MRLTLLKQRLENLGEKNLTDAYLENMLLDAEAYLLDCTNRTELNTPLERVVVDVAVHDYLLQGQAGETSRSEGGISVNYEKNYPDRVLKAINSNRLLKGARYAART